MARILRPNFTAAKNAAGLHSKPGRPAIPIYQFHIALGFTDPPVWRRIQVCGGQSLAELHRILQISFGWDDTDQHQFLVGKVFFKNCGVDGDPRDDDESRVSLHALAEAMKFIFTYIYDGGPGWEGEITLEEIQPGTNEHFAPRVLAGAGRIDATEGGTTTDVVDLDLQAINLKLTACYPLIRPTGLKVTSDSSIDT